MRIDAHHHLWTYTPEAFGWIAPDSAIARDFTVKDLERCCTESGVDATIAVQARQTPEETRFLLRCAAESDRITGVVGWIDLRAPDIDGALAADAAPGLVGYRHVVQDEPDPDFLLGQDFQRGVRAVLSRDLSYDILVNPAQLPTVPAFVDAVGFGRLILDHAAKPDIRSGAWQPWADHIAAVAQCPSVYCKISGLVTEADHDHWTPEQIERYLVHVFDLFGPERVIWGSDWPVCRLAAPYQATRDLVDNFVMRHCPEALDAVFSGNALRAYALQEQQP